MSADGISVMGVDQYPVDSSVKLHGPPGCGKTTQLQERVVGLLEDGYEISDICFVTYRREMAQEFLLRLYESGHITRAEMEEPYDNDTRYFGTLHAVCNRMSNSYKDVATATDKRDFCDTLYNVGFDGRNDRDPVTDTASESAGSAMFEAYQWLIENKRTSDGFSAYPSYNELNERWPFHPTFNEFDSDWSDYKIENGLRDFSDMLRTVDEEGTRPPRKVVVADEYHDFTPIMHSIVQQWMDAADVCVVGGDPLQCIPEGDPILTPDGYVPIEEVQSGDEVCTAIGSHDVDSVKVDSVHSRGGDEPVARFVTESGAEFSCTLDHELFARTPHQRHSDGGYHFVYVMESGQRDYRIGTTEMPQHRLNSEPSATRMMVVGAWDNREEALAHERRWSYKYGLPQDPFMARESLEQETIDSIYDSLDTRSGFESLCGDKHIDPDRWHLYCQSSGSADATLGRPGGRVVVRFKMGRSKKRQSGGLPYIFHKICVETSNEDAIHALRQFDSLSETTAKSGRRFRKQSTDYGMIRRLAHSIADTLTECGIAAHVDEKAAYSSMTGEGRTSGLPVVGASQVTEGMYVPVVEDGTVRYEKVVSKEVEETTTTVYDLTVSPTHNYVVGGVVVHNSIYTYKGATPDYFRSVDYPEVLLDRSYRLPENVWNYARSILSGDQTPPGVTPDSSGGEVSLKEGSPRAFVSEYAGEESVMFLARTRSQVRDICSELREEGIIFRSQAKMGGWNESPKRLNIYNALAKIEGCSTPRGVNPHTGQATLTKSLGDSGVGGVKTPSAITLTPGEVSTLVSLTPSDYFVRTKKEVVEWVDELESDIGGDEFAHRVDAIFWEEMTNGADSVGNLLSYSAADTLETALRKDGEPYDAIESADIPSVLTIHAAKGREADTVIVFDGITPQITESIMADPEKREAEDRVWYVAATRAASRLLIVRNAWDYTTDYLPDPQPTLLQKN